MNDAPANNARLKTIRPVRVKRNKLPAWLAPGLVGLLMGESPATHQPGRGESDLTSCKSFRTGLISQRFQTFQAECNRTVTLSLRGEEKHQAPTSKRQRSSKSKAPNISRTWLEVWSLKFLWSLEVGACFFSFHQFFRDLHGVERRAFEQLVAAHPKAQAVV